MALRSINTIEQILVRFIVEVGAERLVVEMLGTCPEDLIRANRRSMWLSFDHSLAFFFWWWCEVGVSVEIVLLELERLTLHSLNFLEILFVVQAVAEHVAESA
jgi:hypothetical protein